MKRPRSRPNVSIGRDRSVARRVVEEARIVTRLGDGDFDEAYLVWGGTGTRRRECRLLSAGGLTARPLKIDASPGGKDDGKHDGCANQAARVWPSARHKRAG